MSDLPIPADGQVLITLTLVCDETTGDFAQEWFNTYADNARDGLSEMGLSGDIVLSSSDGIYEVH